MKILSVQSIITKTDITMMKYHTTIKEVFHNFSIDKKIYLKYQFCNKNDITLK